MSGHSCYTGCQPDPFNHETATPIPSLWTGFPSPVEKAALRAFRISFAAQPSLSARNVRLGFKMARSDFAGSTLGSEPSSPTSPMGSDRSRGSSAPTTVTAASVDPLINPTQAIDGAEHQPTPSLASIAIEEPIPAEGWLDLARLMTKTPDFAAFSRFHDLHIKNLLYYQVELSVLREQLKDLEELDRDSNGLDLHGESEFHKEPEKIFWGPGTNSKQFLKIRELRECLKGYGMFNLVVFSSVRQIFRVVGSHWHRRSALAVLPNINAP